ncbi:MAG: tripartite tricarboxylate transporter substrate binding protein [Betaproteobacteria bacterium]|nr:tripartite tricarboxylate transporter substrate binding protein [Betaproteobacteria bacterium]
MNRTTKRARCIALAAVLLAAASACAQYPTRAVRLILPNPPGGATDTLGRVLAPRLAEALGQPVVVENRPGSNGNIAGELVAKSAPDGYSLLLANDSQIVVNPHLYSKMPFDVLKDIVPVASVAYAPVLLGVVATLPVKDFAEFLAYARRANPSLAYASIGNGSQHHLAMEMLKARAGINLVHIPYKGGGPAALAMLSGDVSAMFGGTSILVHVKTGKVKIIATSGKTRHLGFPDLPTIGEYYPGYESGTWLAVYATAGTPAPVIARLRGEINKLLADPEFKTRLASVGGMEAFQTTPEAFDDIVRADHAKYGQVVKSIGATID